MEKKNPACEDTSYWKNETISKGDKNGYFCKFCKGVISKAKWPKMADFGVERKCININSVIVLVAFWRLLDHLRFVLSKKQLVKTPNIKEMRPFPKVAKIANFAKEI